MIKISKLLGKRIKEIRKSRGLTQSELAEIIGMDTINLCKLENGAHLPKEENIVKLATALNIEIKDLFEFGHIKTKEELEYELIKIIKNSSINQLQCYYKLINAVL